ncbi:hypothetical protein TNCV_1923571 [Trichonephila clavipes]|nr:hypothetical protein TNCV_1923571 [Trichonephila clavipes]
MQTRIPWTAVQIKDSVRVALRMHPDHRIFQRLHHLFREARSFHVARNDVGGRRAAGSLSLEESILNVVADRPGSSTRALLLNTQVTRTTPEMASHSHHHANVRTLSLDSFKISFCSQRDISCPRAQANDSIEITLASCQVIYSQFGLAIHQNDHQARRRFVEWIQNDIAVVPDFHKRILFSDEVHFWLNGYVNKQNCRIWSEANPQVYVETPLHPEKLTVWCALWAGGILLQKR